MNFKFDFKYFALCLSLGLSAQVYLSKTYYFEPIQHADQSSVAADASLYAFIVDEQNKDLSDLALDSTLMELNATWAAEESEDYVLKPDELEDLEQKLDTVVSSSEEKNEFNTDLVNFESTSSCESKRLSVEKVLTGSQQSKVLLAEREDQKGFPKSCLTYTMRSFNVASTSYGRCPNGANSEPIRGGNKPCVTKNLVNATYNALMDVTQCFGLKPKSILPKIYNESGFIINVLGGGFDAGVGQMTISGIQEVNSKFDKYINEVKMKASTNPGCAGILKHKFNLTKNSEKKSLRCQFIYPDVNPYKNLLYTAILNRINLDETKRRFEENNIEERIKKLGLTNIDIAALQEIIASTSYNTGGQTAFGFIKSYVEGREAAGLKLKASDFDFSMQKTAQDIDGEEKDVLKIARLNVRSALITSKDTPKDIQTKKLRVRALPSKINNSYKLSFPEHMIYRQNNFKKLNASTITKSFRLYGAPGYAGFLNSKSQEVRNYFENGLGKSNTCYDPHYMKVVK